MVKAVDVLLQSKCVVWQAEVQDSEEGAEGISCAETMDRWLASHGSSCSLGGQEQVCYDRKRCRTVRKGQKA